MLRSRPVVLTVLVVVLTGATGCTLIDPLDDLSTGELPARCRDRVQNHDETDLDCGGLCAPCALARRCVRPRDCATGTCTDAGICGCPSDMIETDVGRTDQVHCIDRTEVTAAAYQAFVSACPSDACLAQQPASCRWNTTVVPGVPDDGSARCPPQLFDPRRQPNLPVVCVDWCDAQQFCASHGRRLCGAFASGPTPFDEHTNARSSQWFSACSLGTRVYPYGATYDGPSCNGADARSGQAAPVASFPGCAGAAEGPFDMSGNVWEWEDSCSGVAGAADVCRIRGGAFDSYAAELTCASPGVQLRAERTPNVGFRCCL